MHILLNTPIQTGACVPPHRLRIPQHPSTPPIIVPPLCTSPCPRAVQAPIPDALDQAELQFKSISPMCPVHILFPRSPPRLDVSAPTFPSYFSSGFFPFSIYYRSRADPGFLPDLSCGVVPSLARSHAFSVLCPVLPISLSVLLPLPSSGLSPAPRHST